ncbi:MAG: sulfotransferase [Candidatus Eremiobacteraeota bacterium]|nr:sulfotransferase [Candidatus Eremiobacteraeota bacterium]
MLTDPRPLLPWWARFLNELGRRSGYVPVLDEEEMLATARRRTGLRDFGADTFREPLRVLLRAWKEEAGLSPLGRWLVRQEGLLRLCNRLRIQDTLQRYPQILDFPLQKPLVITGLPRSGTTLLHNLLSQDPQARPLLFWEGRRPAPPPSPDNYRNDSRVARSRWELRGGMAIIPEVVKAHWAESDAPAECNGLFQNSFMSPLFGVMASLPNYGQWLLACDPLPAYREYRRQLQLLGWNFPGRRWVLKAPAHMFARKACERWCRNRFSSLTTVTPQRFCPRCAAW